MGLRQLVVPNLEYSLSIHDLIDYGVTRSCYPILQLHNEAYFLLDPRASKTEYPECILV
jgi:hypothetical protein